MKGILEQSLLFSLSVIACLSCKKQAEDSSLASDAILNIRFKQARVFASAETDSVKLYTWLTRDSAASDGVIYSLPIHKQVFTAKMSKAERDSMYQWVKKMIVTPVKQMSFCTDYVGYINLAIVSGQVSQECTYTSVCEWERLSPESQKLKVLIKSKFANF